MRVTTSRADTTTAGSASAARKSRPIPSPQVTRITYPVTGDNSPVDVEQHQQHHHPHSSNSKSAHMPPRFSSSSHTPTTTNSNSQSAHLSVANEDNSFYDHEMLSAPSDHVALDELWGSIRQTKAKKMAKEKPKVESLEEPRPGLGHATESRRSRSQLHVEQKSASRAMVDVPTTTVDVPLTESADAKSPPPPAPSSQLQRQKSVTSFRESPDGRTMVASLDMRDVPKENIHVSFQRHRLVVTWATLEIDEWEEEDGVIVREKYEKNYQRTFPLPEGTRFEEINGAMRGKYLLLKYPNCRAFRVEGRSEY